MLIRLVLIRLLASCLVVALLPIASAYIFHRPSYQTSSSIADESSFSSGSHSGSEGSHSSSSDFDSSGVESSLSEQSFSSEEGDDCWEMVAVGQCQFSRFYSKEFEYHRVSDSDTCRMLCETCPGNTCLGYNLYGRSNVFHCELVKEIYTVRKQHRLASCSHISTRYWKFWQNVCLSECVKSCKGKCTKIWDKYYSCIPVDPPTRPDCTGTANPKCCQWKSLSQCEMNGGHCKDIMGAPTCQCPCGKSGKVCEHSSETKCCNWRSESACHQNGGICRDTLRGPVCDCACGRTGNLCQRFENKCCTWHNQPACERNGGKCTDRGGHPTCQCPCGRSGDVCQIVENKCCSWFGLAACQQNGGRCSDRGGVAICSCPCGRTGTTCQLFDNKCCVWDRLQQCNTNGGRCDDSSGRPVCQCPCGKSGTTCQIDNKQCCSWEFLTACGQNGGTCDDTTGRPRCVCPCGRTGTTCQLSDNKCCVWDRLQQCNSNGGRCDDSSGRPVCQCPCGKSGTTCQIDNGQCCSWEFLTACGQNGGTCDDTTGRPRCVCPCGRTGTTCQITEDKCCNWDLGPACRNSGSNCTDTSSGPVCECKDCRVGPTCQQVKNSCKCQSLCAINEDCYDTYTGSVCVPKCKDSTGPEFTLMFIENLNHEDRLPVSPPMEVYVSSADNVRGVRVRVYTTSTACPGDQTVIVPPRESKRVLMPACIMQRGTGLDSKAVRVEELDGKDLVVYGTNKVLFSADGFLALPDAVAGTDYVTTSYAKADNGTELGVVALTDNTKATITLSTRFVSVTYGGITHRSGQTFVVDMNRFDTLQLQSSIGDLTGTHVSLTHPGHVYSGNIRVSVPSTPQSRDHLVEQLLSTDKWGREFVIVGIPGRPTGEVVRVVTGAMSVTITVFKGGIIESYNIPAYDQEQIEIRQEPKVMYLISSSPVSVFQFTASRAPTETIHDPSLITIIPNNLFTNDFVVNTPLFTGGTAGGASGVPVPYDRNILLLVAEDADRAEIMIGNSSVVESSWTRVPAGNRSPALYFTTADVLHGNHFVHHIKGDVQFMAYAYGAAHQESYGFPLKVTFEQCGPTKPPLQPTG